MFDLLNNYGTFRTLLRCPNSVRGQERHMPLSPAIAALARPSGGLAMLAVDQREALRAMIAEATGQSPSAIADQRLTDFKVAVAEHLSPYASALLVEAQFGWDAVVNAAVVAPSCALIAAADKLIPGKTEFVGDSVIDETVDPAVVRAQGAKALKLLVVWRPDGDARQRITMVEDFVARCRAAGLASIIEPVSRAPLSGGEWDADAGILAAARELGRLGADIYKSEVPTHGRGSDRDVEAGCAAITEAVDGAWVVLSSGVDANRFPEAVALACKQGASGFLAGRAVWASVVGHADLPTALRTVAADRLRRLCDVVDNALAARGADVAAAR
jgi:sulfofructosephosphate aldolase